MAEPGDIGARVLEAVRAGSAPRQARLAAASGALPLTAAVLLELQIFLVGDADVEIAERARESVGRLSPEVAAQVVADPAASPEVLAHLARDCARWPAAAEQIAASTRIAPEALRPLASSSFPDVLAALVRNNAALSRDAELGALLARNPALPAAERLRLLDYLEELAKPQPGAPIAAPDAGADLAPARDPFLAALGVDAEVEALLPSLDLDMGQLQERSELLGEAVDADEQRLLARISRMKVGQKLRVALFGGREERLLLIRDSNRIVASAVLKNPKFTQQEAEFASNSRNVCIEVLRLLAQHREFSKVHKVQHSLVCNPRCPPAIAVSFVPNLPERELRLLLKNRNVSEAVRVHARKVIDAREARQRVRLIRGKH